LLENWPSKVLSFAAAVGLFFFNRINSLEERTLRIPLAPALNEDFVPASEYPLTVSVTIRGEKAEINQIAESDLIAVLDLTGFRSEGSFLAPVTITRSGNAVKAEPLEYSLSDPEIPIAIERKVTKTVPIEPVFKGYLESGFELERIELVPDRVEVSGPWSLVQGVQSIGTEVIELTGRKGDFSLSTRLQRKDQLIAIAGPAEITLNAIVRQSRSSKFYDGVRIAAVNARPGLVFSFKPGTGAMTLSGPQVELDQLVAESLVLTVDVGSIGEVGEYELPLTAVAHSTFALEGFSPGFVTVIVTEEGP
jgi:YbbR domain-containing protein